MNVLCLGGSYTGRYLSRNFGGEHFVCFMDQQSEQLRRRGFRAATPEDLAEILAERRIDMVLDTVPPVPDGAGCLIPPYAKQVDWILGVNPSAVYVHISSTSVYPPGKTVEDEPQIPVLDETSPTGPETDKGAERLLLERRILGLYAGASVVRSGGIYGPGRCIALRFRNGDFRRTDLGNKMVSRIHVHDLCRLVLAIGSSEANGSRAPRYVNGVDECPSSNRETFGHIEETLGITIPGNWRDAPPSGRKVVSLYAGRLLGGRYEYPSYREGFAHCLHLDQA